MNKTCFQRIPLPGRNITLLAVFAGLLIFACGCSAHRSTPPIPSENNLPPGFRTLEDAYWWRCRFKHTWPKEGDADLSRDLLLAHAVVSPALAAHAADIPYWRFHRRAVRDTAGHQFTFLFYSRPEIAAAVFAEIARSRVLRSAMTANFVEKVMMDDPDHPKSPDIGETSDPRWSSALRKNWPAFIMGVSSFWLGLIDDGMNGLPGDGDDPHGLMEKYRGVDAGITEIWRDQGQHALLHHLNAVFGYEEMLIQKAVSF
ncbi:hypothetical protein [Desulfococcus sp.]|uniref:hypothetical protein n=1 Tax=Desulfococcus sp. TaxID=2025834 RepID=UPI0035937F59